MSDIRTIRIFIASPGDLAVERRAFKDVIDELNGDFAIGARVVGWVSPTNFCWRTATTLVGSAHPTD